MYVHTYLHMWPCIFERTVNDPAPDPDTHTIHLPYIYLYYIPLIFMVNVRKYTIHGWYGIYSQVTHLHHPTILHSYPINKENPHHTMRRVRPRRGISHTNSSTGFDLFLRIDLVRFLSERTSGISNVWANTSSHQWMLRQFFQKSEKGSNHFGAFPRLSLMMIDR